ncbi:Uncharacterized protein BM_BM10542 [Brugia malayi]|uniref:Uncharacterized protein n=1 Tax=Brugia malayi TaxID=6279 RepID=A0A4E9G0M9_BRUMA|nr:Uncharacterized protein BM_BM10542 [Brugia malayi]VIO98856.1 Uncharacterized protein BM_BM10542 [Brugia malayi]
MLFISINILCIVEDSSIFAWVNNSMSIIDDARMQKMDDLRQTINSKYYQKLLNLMLTKKERQKRQIEEPTYLGTNRIFTKLDNTVASMITTIAIYELNDINVIWIFMLIIYWMLIPVFIWVAIILFMWKNLRLHWRKIIAPMATAKHCEASGNLLNVENEIMTMPTWDGILEARFEQTTQSVHDEIKWFPEEDTAEMRNQGEKKTNTE